MVKWCAIAVAVAALIPSLAAAAPVTSSVWVVPVGSATTAGTSVTLHYGDAFTAGYTTKASEPWAFVQCWANDTTILGVPNQGTYSPGDVIWSEYRSVYDGGPISPTFELVDPIQQLWLGGGADCRIDLIKFSAGYKNQTVLASTTFTVTG